MQLRMQVRMEKKMAARRVINLVDGDEEPAEYDDNEEDGKQ